MMRLTKAVWAPVLNDLVKCAGLPRKRAEDYQEILNSHEELVLKIVGVYNGSGIIGARLLTPGQEELCLEIFANLESGGSHAVIRIAENDTWSPREPEDENSPPRTLVEAAAALAVSRLLQEYWTHMLSAAKGK